MQSLYMANALVGTTVGIIRRNSSFLSSTGSVLGEGTWRRPLNAFLHDTAETPACARRRNDVRYSLQRFRHASTSHVALLFTYYKIVHEVHAIRTDSKNNENCKSSTRHKHWIKHHIICQCVMSPIKPKLIATHVGAGVSRDQDICATCTTNC